MDALSDKDERTVDGRGSSRLPGLAATLLTLVLAFSACSNAGSEAPDNLAALDDISQHRTHQQVTVEGTVAQMLRTSTSAEGRHERFVLDVHTGSGDEQLILVAHNIDIAPEVPLQEGDDVIVHGELELDPQGPVIHWTHHDPRGRNPPGFIKVHGQTYE
ncbi:MAG: DUF3465 domain-containing protein [Candidatus Eremiobacteraeota bacterium]|nr:DUF3465 domain-containing protein [Candidatus Eremiobacteraeota bacterium]MBV8366177.1 DUF3465 domain-containing protein [Candidatus Eremiobacteraeota bacterium]